MGYDFHLDDRDARVLPRRAGSALAGRALELEIEGRALVAALEPGTAAGEFFLTVDGVRERIFLASKNDVHFIHWRGRTHRVEARNALERVREQAKRAGGAEEVRAPMPGVVVSVAVAVGDAVETGALLLTIESMKLQTAITATHPARVAELCVAAGENFDQGAALVRLAPLDAGAKPAAPKKGRKR
ncbi:MAG: biotin/lipoyl-containing protein [Myxococcota bacterium]